VRKIVDVPLGYSRDDLHRLRFYAERDYPALTQVINAYLELSDRAMSDITLPGRKSRAKVKSDGGEMHLFDLLRERKFFPSNSDLSQFAGRVLPNMSRKRFDKMSRADIAARIIEYLETTDPRTRARLESSMREAMALGTDRIADRKTFLSKWEKIIKGIDL